MSCGPVLEDTARAHGTLDRGTARQPRRDTPDTRLSVACRLGAERWLSHAHAQQHGRDQPADLFECCGRIVCLGYV